jgi:hypothetical protein
MTFSRSTRLAAIGLAFMALVSVVNAACPNGCSNKGVCGQFDKCTCYPGYTEADCSARLCEDGKAWADIKDTSVTDREPHYFAECSNKGVCDREKGVCECLEGFEGKSCQRLSCPEGCSGHGVCQLMEDANSGYALWDKDMVQVCSCDNGWSGIDCAKRDCKLGDDPLTTFDMSGNSLEADESQVINIVTATAAHASASFILGYTDWRGEVLYTHPIAFPPTVIAIEEALEALPNNAIPTVTVGTLVENTLNVDYTFTVTFTDVETKGNQPALTVGLAGCTLDGCQPVYYGVYDGSAVLGTATVTQTDGTAERSECSGRGICDNEQGLCTCFEGYYGVSCNKQTIIM